LKVNVCPLEDEVATTRKSNLIDVAINRIGGDLRIFKDKIELRLSI
jgi:hypothetical protein